MKNKFPPHFSLSRMIIFVLLLSGSFLVIIYRLYVLQIVQHEKWVEFGENEYSRSLKISKRRGEILDTRHNRLAVSEPVYSVFVDPASFPEKNSETLISEIAETLSLDSKKLTAKLESIRKYRFYWLKRKLSDDEYIKLSEKKIPGIHFKREFARRYPEKNIAAQLIGFVGIDGNDILDNKGLEGLEYSCNDIISGRFVYVQPEREEDLNEDRSPSVVLTVDSVIQHICETALEKQCRDFKALSGQIVVLEPSTGKILALANYPGFDPNRFNDFPPEYYRNRTVTDVYEPGSVFKVITVSSALNEKVITTEEKFLCTAAFIVDTGKPIKCSIPHGWIAAENIITYSCNPGISQIGMKLGKNMFHQYIDRFGFLNPPGLNLPGERTSLIKPAAQWYPRDLASISFGSAVATTSLHLARAFSAIANGGVMMKPMLIEKIVSQSGKILQEYHPQSEGIVLSPETCSSVIKMLENGVLHGTGKKALIQGYTVAGKTGTPQIPGKGGYQENKYNSVFLGIAPSDKPRIVTCIQISEPSVDIGYGGGAVAAPVFPEIAEKILRYLEVFPKIEKTADSSLPVADLLPLKTPDYVGMTLREIESIRKNSRLKFRLKGDGDLIIYQLPKAGTQLNQDSEINLYFGDRALYDKLYTSDQHTMPSLTGKTMKEVVNLLKDCENPLRLEGNGMVESQKPAAGSKLYPTTEIFLKFSTFSERYTDEVKESSREVSRTDLHNGQ